MASSVGDITLSARYFEELMRDRILLWALQAEGVQQWLGYQRALKRANEDGRERPEDVPRDEYGDYEEYLRLKGHDPDLDENGYCRICGAYEPE